MIPSTNTDGLYSTDISFEENNRILNEVVADMYIDIEPEKIEKFVSKDSNNRLENHKGTEITVANGGSLGSYNGPEPVKNLSHPAISDRILADYLNEKENAADQDFDREFAKDLMLRFIEENDTEQGRFTLSRFFQWIMSSSRGSRRYIFSLDKLEDGNLTNPTELQHYSRIFLVKKEYLQESTDYESFGQTLMSTAKDKINPKKPPTPDPIAVKIHKDHGYIAGDENQYSKVIKVSGLDEKWNVLIENGSMKDMAITKQYGPYKANFFKDVLDLDAYIDYIETTFNNSWKNPEIS